MSSSATTYLRLVAGMAIFGSGTPISKIVTGAFPVFTASAVRMLLAAVVLLGILSLQRQDPLRERLRSDEPGLGISGADWLRLGGIALAGMFLFSVFMLYGMKEVSGAVGGIVMAMTPAVTATGAVLFLGDQMTRWKSIAIGCAVGGVILVNIAGTGDSTGDHIWLGAALVFGAVCGEAAYTLIGKRLTADMTPLDVSLLAAALALPLFAVPAVLQVSELDWSGISWDEWAALVWWGVGTMGIGSLLWYQGVQQVSGTTASAFMAVMPVSAMVLSYILIGEAFHWAHLIGLVAVLAAIAFVVKDDREAAGDDS